jgi:hypothetical protein
MAISSCRPMLVCRHDGSIALPVCRNIAARDRFVTICRRGLAAARAVRQSMIPKSAKRFSEKIMLKQA